MSDFELLNERLKLLRIGRPEFAAKLHSFFFCFFSLFVHAQSDTVSVFQYKLIEDGRIVILIEHPVSNDVLFCLLKGFTVFSEMIKDRCFA